MNRPRIERTQRFAVWLAVFLFAASIGDAFAQITALPRTDSSSGDFFGTAVAIHGDRVLVGATGVDSCGTNSGAAYVYRRVEKTDGWEFDAELLPDDCEAETFFGRSVALSERFAVVAASNEFFSRETPNAVYVFEPDEATGAWRQTAKLTGGAATNEGNFAMSVSIDGDRLLVTTSGDPSGHRVDGAAYVFEYDALTRQWVRAHHLTGSGTVERGVFGTSGAIDGAVAAVTASTYIEDKPGSVFIFEADSSRAWSEEARFGRVDDFFISVAVDDGRVLVGESKANRNDSGTATLFEKDRAGGWRIGQVLRPVKPYDAGAFGSGVALDGPYALVIGFDEQLGLDVNIDRVVFVFKHDPAAERWRQYHIIDVGEVSFGADIDVHDGYAVVGSASEGAPGAAYVVGLSD